MHLIKEDWSFAPLESGVQCVTISASEKMRHLLCVVSWDISQQVYIHISVITQNNVCKYCSAEPRLSNGVFGSRPSRQMQEMDLFKCNGDEAQLADCRRERSRSCSSRDVEVICS